MRTRPGLFVLLAAASVPAQSIDVWTSGPWTLGQAFNGVNLSGPAGYGFLAAAFDTANPPVPTPFGALWLAGPPIVLGSGALSAGGTLASYLAIPADPVWLGVRFSFQGALLPAAAPGTLVLGGGAQRRIGPMPAIGPLTPFGGELFGRSIACGDRDENGTAELAVGAPGAWNATGTVGGVGAVGVYGGSPLALVQTLSGSQGGANFGHSVALAQVDGISGLDLIVGEPAFDPTPIQVEFGRVHVFFAPGYASGTVLEYPSPAGGPLQYFGFEVIGADLGGPTANVVVGAPALGSTPSRVHVFGYAAGGLSLAYSLTNPAGGAGDFGRALAAGDVASGTPAVELCVGDPSFSPPGGFGRGRVYLFAGGALAAFVDSPAPVDYGRFGHAVACGDFTGDGTPDLAVGAPGEGRVYVFAGGSGGPVGAPVVLEHPGPSGGAGALGFGTTLLATLADGDTALDLVVGHLPASGIGQAFVFLGTPGAPNSWQLVAQQMDWDTAAALYGTAFAAGDTDGDGAPELFGGAPLKSTGVLTPGLVFAGRL